MNEMIERVARAICKADGQDPDHEGELTDEGTFQWQSYVTDARAAIEAMREPTKAMIAACYPDEDAGLIWRDMIDAALKEP